MGQIKNIKLHIVTDIKTIYLLPTLDTMEQSLKLIQEQCGEEIASYMNCVENNIKTYHTDCAELHDKLNKCSTSNPTIKHINQSCSPEFDVYNACLKENPTGTKCIGVLELFNECATRAAEEYKKKAAVE